MAHFAQLDDNNIVTQVIVVANEELLDNGIESEAKGVAFCNSLFGGTWKQTSYNGKIRKNFAGIGYSYDSTKDAFIPIKRFSSWVLDENTCQWVAPIPEPNDGNVYAWSESKLSWIQKPDSGLWTWNINEEIWEEYNPE